MLGEICAEIRNYFTYREDIHVGDWVIDNGAISPALVIPTDYIRVVGSRLNDGVHKRNKQGVFELVDEAFHGGIWVMSPPADFLALAAEIEAWQEKNGDLDGPAMSPFNSESFGGYSYSKSGGNESGGSSSAGADWAAAFASRLKIYRRIRVL